ncbi:MAG: 1-(5-phosphoribosyl)-5-[(5-phosphoribosylamino)methylideneamino]imidazole-4-carboxamide isomerase [Bacteroidota bacterium]
MLVIPAIDILDGKCVRLRKGSYDDQTVYGNSPSDVASVFAKSGFPFLHLVDLDGAKQGSVRNWDALATILSLPGVEAEVGGGVRSEQDVHRLLDAGAQRIILGSIAMNDLALTKRLLRGFGDSSFAVAVDVRHGKMAHHGWLKESPQSPKTFLRSMMETGVKTFICTDIERDGMMQGPNLTWYEQLRDEFTGITLIASGGVASANDVNALEKTGVDGVIVGRALYEKTIALEELKKYAR